MQSKLLLAGAIASTLLAVGCGGSSSTSQASPSPVPSPSAAAAGTTIAVATNAKLGQILVDSKGMTLYLFVHDTGPISTCYNACAQIWPPVITTDTPKAGTGVAAELLGTTMRDDGKLEVTYNHHPLYYFVQDKKAGDATGQGVDGFGGLWWVLSPSGAAITIK
jgi:predicted lipoprotein with Yx(FWY)xxD motif